MSRVLFPLGNAISSALEIRTWSDLVALFRPDSEFVTFWHGPLDALTYTCLASFPHYGATLKLYSYDTGIRVPAGVEVVDARSILRDEGLINRYIVNGHASFSKFSNYFRYRLLQRTGACWVDADILCLRRPDFSDSPLVFGYQMGENGPSPLNGAVLKLPRKHPMLLELTARAAAAVDIDTQWGVLGPRLISELAKKHGVMHHARPEKEFYPVWFQRFWQPLLPGYKPFMERRTAESTFLHLWNEYYRECGYDKSMAPPEGSFLHEQCIRLGTLGEFRSCYDAAELRSLLGDRLKN